MPHIERPEQSMPAITSAADFFSNVSNALAKGISCCIATVLARTGSAPSTPGQKLVVFADGTSCGTVGGGAIEREVMQRIRQVLSAGHGELAIHTFQLSQDLGMVCGGEVQVLLEPLWPGAPVLILGFGHVGAELARVLLTLGFSVIAIDERAAAFSPDRLSGLEPVKVIQGAAEQVACDFPTQTAAVITTHDHARDAQLAEWALRHSFGYVGVVGSKAKSAKLHAQLRDLGIDPAGRLHMPIGVSIGARTPQEIAISIAAELVAWRAGMFTS